MRDNVEAESPEDYFRKVVLDGYSSEESSVISGVPQVLLGTDGVVLVGGCDCQFYTLCLKTWSSV
jgi:hypothetical protein